MYVFGTEMCSTSFNYQFYESNHLRGIEVLRNILIAAILILEAGFGFTLVNPTKVLICNHT